ncbi:hypothetical protein MIND_00735400 [Mycena indigotica]|uniref:Ribosomal protein eL8/eL30/eS12/Gadd45 domain-containing protein n=1 Tax=Mycena indigotica TaxID=2126181 RepID=A0A8H6SLT9_9AGAR|nr:uncharacterized protein MIND_00735400 [Mycena indigotica]KAF7301699.1 hypothetical protein MIND_00735400 [Mycena indigotica]
MSTKPEKKSKRRKTEEEENGEPTMEAKSPKKAKKEKDEMEIDVPLEDLSPIAHPLAQKKLLKKVHKTIKKASKARQIKRGVKEVVKGIRKGEKGLLILAADINPIDIISHLPILSEEAQIPYIFVPSKEELGNASSTKRPTSCVMVCPDQKKKAKAKDGDEKDEDYRELYDEVRQEVEALDTKITPFATAFATLPFLPSYFAMAPKAKKSPAADVEPKGTAPPSTNGTTTPAEKNDTSDAPTGRPDKKVFDAEQDKLKADIDALQAKLSAVRDKIGLATKSGPGNDRRKALLAELDSIRGQQSETKVSRNKIHENLKSMNESIAKKVKDLQAAKSKTPFKTVAEVDAHIKQLERQVESGTMKLVEEKRALQEINTQKRNRRTVENFQAEQEAIDRDRAAVDELRKQLEDPVARAASERFDAIKAELDVLKKEGDEAYNSRSKLFEERDKIQNDLNTLYNEKREASQRFRDLNDRYWAKVNEDRARRAERLRAQRAAEELQKKQERAARIREEAESPAYQAQIEDCQTLIDYFSGKTTGTVSLNSAPLTTKADVAGVPKLDIRQVEAAPDGVVVRKKKGEDDEAYFVGGKGKGKGKKSTPKTTDAEPTGQLNVPFATLSALLALSIPPPLAHGEVPRVIEDLKTKKEWFEANQARVTSENIAKAEAEIQALNAAAKESKGDENGVVGNGKEPSPSPAPEVVAE